MELTGQLNCFLGIRHGPVTMYHCLEFLFFVVLKPARPSALNPGPEALNPNS